MCLWTVVVSVPGSKACDCICIYCCKSVSAGRFMFTMIPHLSLPEIELEVDLVTISESCYVCACQWDLLEEAISTIININIMCSFSCAQKVRYIYIYISWLSAC